MNDLVIMHDRQAVTTSLRVAEVFGKEHKKVLRAIETKINGAKNGLVENMFAEGVYTDKKGEQRKMYYLNRDGFTFIAFGFTGRQADEFKLKYIQAFNEMEQQVKLGTPNMDGLSESTKALLLATQSIAQIEQSMAKTNKRIDKLEEDQEGIRKIATFDADDDWRKKTNRMINSIIVNHYNKDFNAAKDLRAKIYADVEGRAHVKLSLRLKNKQARMALQGASKTKVDAVNKLDVIADDPKLIEVYVAVVRKYAMYYGG